MPGDAQRAEEPWGPDAQTRGRQGAMAGRQGQGKGQAPTPGMGPGGYRDPYQDYMGPAGHGRWDDTWDDPSEGMAPGRMDPGAGTRYSPEYDRDDDYDYQPSTTYTYSDWVYLDTLTSYREPRPQVDPAAVTIALLRGDGLLPSPRLSISGSTRYPEVGKSMTLSAEPHEVDLDFAIYEWDFGDGESAIGKRIEHAFEKPGTYTVKVALFDGETYAYQTAVVIAEDPPGRPVVIPFGPGWNLISLPGRPVDSYLYDVLREAGLESTVWAWQDEDYGSVWSMEPKTGYWIRNPGTQPTELKLRAVPEKHGVVVLREGWNLVGPTVSCPRPSDGQVVSVWDWDPDEQTYTPISPAGTLQAGRGYWLYAAKPSKVRLDDRPCTPGKTVVCFGDSLTTCGGPDGRFSDILQDRFPDHTFFNKGVSGETFDSAVRRVEDDVLAIEPDVVLVEFGANDWRWNGRPPVQWARDLDNIVTRIQATDARAVILGVFGTWRNEDGAVKPRDPGEDPEGMIFQKLEEEVAKKHGCGYVANIQEWIKARRTWILWRDDNHPNERGNRHVADTVEPILARLLGTAPRAVRRP